MLSVPNGATSRRLQLPYELAYGLQKLERLVVHIVKRIRHQEEDYLALHSSAADVSPAVAKLWASTCPPSIMSVFVKKVPFCSEIVLFHQKKSSIF